MIDSLKEEFRYLIFSLDYTRPEYIYYIIRISFTNCDGYDRSKSNRIQTFD